MSVAVWDSFYVIVSSTAGALIGLPFVVVTLIVERSPLPAAVDEHAGKRERDGPSLRLDQLSKGRPDHDASGRTRSHRRGRPHAAGHQP